MSYDSDQFVRKFIWGSKGPRRGEFALNRESPQAKGLINWWPLKDGGNFIFEPVARYNGVLTSSPPWVGSELGQVVSFDGTADYVTVTLPSADFRLSAGVTVCFWNYVAAADVQEASAFGGYGTDDSDDRIQAHVPWSDTTVYFDYGNQTTGRVSTSYSGYTDRWTHVALVSTGSTATKFKGIYFNGILKASAADADQYTGTIGTFDIGRANLNANTYYHKGKIFDFRIYDRVLNASEVLAVCKQDTRWDLFKPTFQLIDYGLASLYAPGTDGFPYIPIRQPYPYNRKVVSY